MLPTSPCLPPPFLSFPSRCCTSCCRDFLRGEVFHLFVCLFVQGEQKRVLVVEQRIKKTAVDLRRASGRAGGHFSWQEVPDLISLSLFSPRSYLLGGGGGEGGVVYISAHPRDESHSFHFPPFSLLRCCRVPVRPFDRWVCTYVAGRLFLSFRSKIVILNYPLPVFND